MTFSFHEGTLNMFNYHNNWSQKEYNIRRVLDISIIEIYSS